MTEFLDCAESEKQAEYLEEVDIDMTFINGERNNLNSHIRLYLINNHYKSICQETEFDIH